MKHSRVYWLTCVLTVALAASGFATTIVMPTDAQLIEKSPLIVRGTVLRTGAVDIHGGIWTETVIAVSQTLKGSAPETITIREIGGVIGERFSRVFGSPEYAAGENVLVFATPTPRGDYQTVDLFVGKFAEGRTVDGERLWLRHDEQDRVTLLDRDFREIEAANVQREAAGFERFVSDRVAGRAGIANYGVANPVLAREGGALRQAANFTLIDENNTFRWRQFDTGGSVTWRSVGTQAGYTGGGVNEAQTAMGSWTNYASARIRYVYGGTSTAPPGGLNGSNGIHEIIFGDPLNEISGTWTGGSGVVGRGGFQGGGGTHTFTATFAADAAHPAGTQTAISIAEGNLVIQDGVSPTTGLSSNRLAEIIAHEFGHTLGFGHSTDSSALMYPTVTGIGPSLRGDDQTAARWLYPNGSTGGGGGGGNPTPTPTGPAAPSSLSATVSGSNISLQWTDNSSDESGFYIYVASGTGAFARVAQTPAGQRGALLTGYSVGQYRVNVTAWNSAGESGATNTVTVNVAAPVTPPSAAFSFSPQTGVAGVTVFSFNDESTGTVTSRSWDFGDGQTSTSSSVTHVYANPGTYTVRLTVSGAGAQSSAQRSIVVAAPTPPLTVDLAFTPANPTTVDDIQFFDRSTGGAGEWNWNFGDGTSTFLQNPVKRYQTAGTYTVTLTVYRGADTRTTSKSITVTNAVPAGPQVVADFGFTPAAPTLGQSISFLDRSAGGATSWLWNFGDGSSSTVQNPSHTFTTPGAFTVSLRVRNANSESTATRAISVSNAPAPFRSLVSVAAATEGAGGSTWRTEMTLFNAGAESASVQLLFVPGAGGAVQTRNLFLQPRQSITYANALLDVFGMPSGAGAIAIEATSPTTSPLLRITSRTFTNGATGTYGQAVPDVVASELRPTLYLTALTADSAYRTNLGLVNDSPAPIDATLTLFNADGSTLGTANVTVTANTFSQAALGSYFSAINSGSYAGLSVRITAAREGLSGYASVVDNRTQDPVYIQAVPAPSGTSAIIPVIGRAPGANGTFWRSDVTMFNPTAATMTLRVRYLVANADNRNAPTRDVTLPARRSAVMEDIVNWLGSQSGSGALEVTWTGDGPIITSRTYTPTAEGGTYGQSIDPVASFGRDVYVTGLRSDASFRSNVGFVNSGDASLPVEVTLLAGDGRTLGSAFVELAPKSQVQHSIAGLFPGVDVASIGSFTLYARAESPNLFAYGSIVDNASGDPVFFAGE